MTETKVDKQVIEDIVAAVVSKLGSLARISTEEQPKLLSDKQRKFLCIVAAAGSASKDDDDVEPHNQQCNEWEIRIPRDLAYVEMCTGRILRDGFDGNAGYETFDAWCHACDKTIIRETKVAFDLLKNFDWGQYD